MKNLVLFLLFIFSNSFFLAAQPTIQWQKCLGGTNRDEGLSITQTFDSGYVFGGWTMSTDGDISSVHGSYDYWVIRLNSVGDTLWQRSLGGSGYNYATCVQQTSDSGFIITGYTTSNDGDVSGNHGSYDIWVVKLFPSGTIEWQKCYGGTAGEFSQSIRQTSDGGYIVANKSNSINGDVNGNHGLEDFWIVKLNNIGDTLWEKSFGGPENDRPFSVWQTFDQGYIVSGLSHSIKGNITAHHGTTASYDNWVVKLDSTGIMEWEKSLGGSNNEMSAAVQQTSDSGYIIAGQSESIDGDVTGNHGNYDYWVVKLNPAGDTLWQKSYGGTASDIATSIEQTSDSGYIVAGYSASNDGDVTVNQGAHDYWMVKLNASGNIVWQKSVGGTADDWAYSVHQTFEYGYVLAGNTTSTNGDVTGHHGTLTNNDYWVVKLSPVILSGLEVNTPLSGIRVTPNPVSNSTQISFSLLHAEKISVSVYDITGRLITKLIDGNLAAGNHKINWNAKEDGVDGGVYIMNISGDGYAHSVKLVVVE